MVRRSGGGNSCVFPGERVEQRRLIATPEAKAINN